MTSHMKVIPGERGDPEPRHGSAGSVVAEPHATEALNLLSVALYQPHCACRRFGSRRTVRRAPPLLMLSSCEAGGRGQGFPRRPLGPGQTGGAPEGAHLPRWHAALRRRPPSVTAPAPWAGRVVAAAHACAESSGAPTVVRPGALPLGGGCVLAVR